MCNIGNRKANEFLEKKLEKYEKINSNSSEEEKRRFIYEKYVKKSWIYEENTINPVVEYVQRKKEGKFAKNLQVLSEKNEEIHNKNRDFKEKNKEKFIVNSTKNTKKSFGFDWEKGGQMADNMKKTWENFENKKIFNRNQSNQSFFKKKEEFDDFKAVSEDLREELLKGNPLERLKILIEKNK